MLPDRVSKSGPLTYESGALLIELRGPASQEKVNFIFLRRLHLLNKCWHVSKGKSMLYINEPRYISFLGAVQNFLYY